MVILWADFVMGRKGHGPIRSGMAVRFLVILGSVQGSLNGTIGKFTNCTISNEFVPMVTRER